MTLTTCQNKKVKIHKKRRADRSD